jgi:hypothetical protein
MAEAGGVNARIRFALLAAAIFTLIAFGALAVWMVTSDVVNFQGVEINVIFTIQKVLLGAALYTSPSLPPFDVAQYTPGYYLVTVGIARVLGFSGGDPAQVAVLARSLSAIFACVALLIYYRILKASGSKDSLRNVMTIAFVVAATFPWLFLARPDALAVLLSLGSLLLLLRSGRSGELDATSYAFAVLLAVSAVAAKQNSVVPLAMVTLTPLVERNWRALVICGVLLIASGVAALGSIAMLGPFVRANVLDGVNNGIDLSWAMMHAYHFIIVWCLPLIAALVATVSGMRRPWTRGERILVSAAAFYFTSACVFSLKWGSAPNYFVEFVFLAAAIVCVGWNGIERSMTSRVMRMAIPAYAVALMGVRFANQYSTYSKVADVPTNHFAGWNPVVRFISSDPVSRGTYTLALDLGLAAKLPRNSVLPSAEIAARAYRRGIVDYSCFHSLVKSGRVRYLVTIPGWKPPEFAGADLSMFKLVGEIGGHWVSRSALPVSPVITGPCG